MYIEIMEPLLSIFYLYMTYLTYLSLFYNNK